MPMIFCPGLRSSFRVLHSSGKPIYPLGVILRSDFWSCTCEFVSCELVSVSHFKSSVPASDFIWFWSGTSPVRQQNAPRQSLSSILCLPVRILLLEISVPCSAIWWVRFSTRSRRSRFIFFHFSLSCLEVCYHAWSRSRRRCMELSRGWLRVPHC
jgi:hypothetical protein